MNDMSQFKYVKDQRPPDLRLCKMHEISCRVGRPIDLDNDNVIDVCPCCGSPFDNQRLPLCENHNKLDFLGPGFPLFYEFLIFCIVCIGLLFLIQGVYGMSTNPDGRGCYLANLEKAGVKCSENGINHYSWFNKEERDDVQSGLNLFGAFALLIVLNIFKHRHKSVEMRLDNDNISPSDYTIQVSELPVTEKEEDIKKFFENCLPNRSVAISKISLAYFVEEYVTLIRRKDALIAKQSNLMSNIIHTEKKTKTAQPVLRKKKEDTDHELADVQRKIEKFEAECQTSGGQKFCGVAFISLQKEEDQEALLKYWERSFFETVWIIIMSRLFKRQSKTYNGSIIIVRRAPEPSDVIWENLGYNSLYRFKALIKTNIGTLITLIACGGAIFGINYAQAAISDSGSGSNKELVQGFGIIAAICVFVVNFLLQSIINILVNLEKLDNFTDFNISLTEKLSLAQFLNTAIVTFVSNYVVSGDKIYGDAGMIYNVFIILISNAVVPLIASYFDVSVVLQFLKKIQIIQEGENSNYTQYEANQAFNGPPVVPSLRYVIIIKSLLVTTFYSSILPIGLLFSFISLFSFYWLDKYLLLRRYSRPQTLGANLSNEMIDVFIELTIAVFSIGCAIFEKILYKSLSWFVITQLVVSLVVFVFPVHLVSEMFCPVPKKKFSGKSYEDVCLEFLNDYDRSNPVTMSNSLKKWVELLSEKEAQGRKHAIQNDENEVKVTRISKNSKLQAKINRLKKEQTEKNKIVPMDDTLVSGKKESVALLQEILEPDVHNVLLKTPSRELEMDQLLHVKEEKRREEEMKKKEEERFEDQKQKEDLLNDIKSLISDAKKTIIEG